MTKKLVKDNIMFFSVIVPVYNVEKYLSQCLDSLVNQTSHDKEIIVVDDGSTDGSGEICDEYAERYDYVTVIHQDNQGLSGARNTGLEHAIGEWVSFVDSDDWVDTDMFERLQGYILATNADFYRFGFKRTNEDGIEKERRRIFAKNTFSIFKDEQAIFRYYLQNHKVLRCVWGGVYRHSIIRERRLRFVDTRRVYAEDILFNFQYILQIKKVVALCYMPYHYRMRKDSLFHITSGEQKLFRCASLWEHAYQTTVTERLTYFQKNFYKIYYHFINTEILCSAMAMDDVHLRQILDKMWKNKFHRKCVKLIRKDLNYLVSRERSWYNKSFGAKGKSVFGWAIWLFLQKIKYTIKGSQMSLFRYLTDEKQHVAYLANYKAACSTIQVSMSRKDGIPDDYSIYTTKRSIYYSSQPIRDKNWFTFTFVRNPFARLVSCYESKYHEDRTRNKIVLWRGFLDLEYYLDGYMKEDKGFKHFVRQVVSIPHQLADGHFSSQYHMLVDNKGKHLVDFIGKVEHLKDDYEPIRQKYGFNPLLHYNKVDYGDWRDYYTTALAKKVYRKYKKDVQYFGYEQEYRDLLEHCKRKGQGNTSKL